MKNILCVLGVLVSVWGCSPVVKMPEFTKTTPDVLTKDTDVILNESSSVTLPKGTDVKTVQTQTKATLGETVKFESDSKVFEFPKNTEIFIPSDTVLLLTEPTNVKLDSGSEISLQRGTEITVTRFNWYALLFYLLLVGTVTWWYIRTRSSGAKRPQLLEE
jgi:hypothetical protein